MIRHFLIAAALALCATRAEAAITISALQSSLVQSLPTANTLAITTNAACGVGNTVVADIATAATATNLSSVADARGNSWTTFNAQANSGASISNKWATANVATALISGDTITGSFSASTSKELMGAACLTGIATSSPIDVEPAAVTGTGTTTSGISSGTLAQANEILLVAVIANASNGGTTCGGSWTKLQQLNSSSPSGAIFCYLVVSSTAPQTCTPTFGNSVSYMLSMISLKASATSTNHLLSAMGAGQ